MDLWQYNEIRKLKARIDDLTIIIFIFLAYELGGFWPALIVLGLDMVMRIFTKNKKNKINLGVISSAPELSESYRQRG